MERGHCNLQTELACPFSLESNGPESLNFLIRVISSVRFCTLPTGNEQEFSRVWNNLQIYTHKPNKFMHLLYKFKKFGYLLILCPLLAFLAQNDPPYHSVRTIKSTFQKSVAISLLTRNRSLGVFEILTVQRKCDQNVACRRMWRKGQMLLVPVFRVWNNWTGWMSCYIR